MSGKRLSDKIKSNFRTWIEIDYRAAKKNYKIFRKLVWPKIKIWSVVKSNAYGHGLTAFSRMVADAGVDGFCVDSVVEGLRLRREGIKKPILVLGPTLLNRLGEAAVNDIAVSVSGIDSLKSLLHSKNQPHFHLKIDTGMHRQGIYLEDLSKVIKILNPRPHILNSRLTGIYTHFASAKDLNYPTYTDWQFQKFGKAVKLFERAGFKNLVKHCAATGATLIDKKYHLDAVRLGIGLYGLWPSRELLAQLGGKIHLQPVLSWRTVVTEVKPLQEGDYVGYDLTERVRRPTKMAVLPVGYWHGYPRALSSIGEVLVSGQRAKVLGRVSMDLLTVDVTGLKCRPGDVATLLGSDGSEELCADEIAQKSGTTHYEFLTRLNPLIERIVT